MKHFISHLTMALLFATTSFAQQVSKDALFGSDYQSISTLSEQAKFSLLSSFGGTGNPGNATIIQQTGNQNSVTLDLKGSGNNIVTKQEGSENSISMNFKGTNSQYLLEQNGDGNTMVMNNIKSSGTNFQATQTDNGNSLTLEGTSIGSLQSMKIEQTGGMVISISSNPYLGN